MQPEPDAQGQITVYLKRLASGDSSAEAPLAELVYTQMQMVARGVLRGRPPDFTLQPTELVNEVLFELVRLRTVDWQDRIHFFRVAARLLRRRFIDYIRERRALKRPPQAARASLEATLLPSEEKYDEVLFVHEGLEKLAIFDPQLAELVELVYFGGVSRSEVAELRGVAEKTISRHLDLARRWLETQYRGTCPALGSESAKKNTV
ncbi:MAG TPA: ECF-type sigma factor [Bryobacteraceae bacterium]|jgi:RNA polymerase sigma factor (TIGR02999 family)